jgi:putative oxidoreductase
MKKLLTLNYLPANRDLALLLLRILVGFSLFYKHGIKKLTGFSNMQKHFPDPLHIGVTTSLMFALLTDGICSLLAASLIIFNLSVVFFFLHDGSIVDAHAEMGYVYLASFLCILLAGVGKYSIDNKLFKA